MADDTFDRLTQAGLRLVEGCDTEEQFDARLEDLDELQCGLVAIAMTNQAGALVNDDDWAEFYRARARRAEDAAGRKRQGQ